MQYCLEPLRQHCIGLWPVQCHPKGIKATLHRICSYTELSGASGTRLHRVFTCAMLSQQYNDNIKQDFFFLIQSCLELLGQYCIGFWPVQCFPRSTKKTLQRIFSDAKLSTASRATLHNFFSWGIKTALDRISSYVMLSGAFRTTLHRNLTCSMLSREYYKNISQDLFSKIV